MTLDTNDNSSTNQLTLNSLIGQLLLKETLYFHLQMMSQTSFLFRKEQEVGCIFEKVRGFSFYLLSHRSPILFLRARNYTST